MEPKRQHSARANTPGVFTGVGELRDKYLYEEKGLELLAYLQYSVDDGAPQSRFLEDVIIHFRTYKTLSCKADWIDLKLKQFWHHWSDPSKNDSEYKQIYAHGVKALPRMRVESASWVKSRAQDLKILYDNLGRGRGRVLRSVSRTPAFQKTQTPIEASGTGPNSKALRRRRKRRRRRNMDSPSKSLAARDVSRVQ